MQHWVGRGESNWPGFYIKLFKQHSRENLKITKKKKTTKIQQNPNNLCWNIQISKRTKNWFEKLESLRHQG